MATRKLPITLCVVQTASTALLTAWADRVDWLLGDSNQIPPPFVKVHLAVIDLRKIWRGINAPTFPFNLAGEKQFQLLGLSVPEILYLFAVAALWYSVGLEARSSKAPLKRSRVLAVASVMWGVILLFLSIVQMPEAFPWTFAFGRVFRPVALINALLYAMWSVVLIWFGFTRIRTSFGSHQNLSRS